MKDSVLCFFLTVAPTEYRGFGVFGWCDGLLVAGGAESGTPALLCFGVASALEAAGWLKTTISAEVGQQGRRPHPVADLLAAYSVENNTLRSSITAIVWHGSCFLLIAGSRQCGIWFGAGLVDGLGGRLDYEE